MREVEGENLIFLKGNLGEEYGEYEETKNETKKNKTMMNDRRCHAIHHDSHELLSNDASLQRRMSVFECSLCCIK
jgi:hypothetical protein